MNALDFRAGPKALEHIRRHGLRAQDIAVVPAAAGGPKGLILQSLDQWLFGHWLPSAPRERTLLGASIGAWRMAAACHADPVAAFKRLGDLYCEQRYPKNPSPQLISDMCRKMLRDFIGEHEAELLSHPQLRLHMLVVRGRGLLQEPQRRAAVMAGFGAAMLANGVSRVGLARHLERVVIGDARDPLTWMKEKFDAFETRFIPLSERNLGEALLASGTLPLVMEPVRGIPHAPPGTYWDGGLIDYHLALPYARINDTAAGGLVLYPHFVDHIVPGWFDKPLPWRRAVSSGNAWLDNVLLVSPSRVFLQTLTRGKLPDRQDFIHYGLDHNFRIRNWLLSIGEGQRLRDEFAAFAENPDLSKVRPL